MKNLFNLLAFLLIISVLSCASPAIISTDSAENLSPNLYKTYNFFSNEDPSDSMSKKVSWSLGMAKLAIAHEMEKKGFVQSGNSPDLMINVGMVVSEQVETRRTNFMQDAPRYIGQRTYSWKSKEVEAGRYNVGTITLDFVDPKENKMIWSGVVEGIVPKKQAKVQKLIQEGVQKLFMKVPLAVKAQ